MKNHFDLDQLGKNVSESFVREGIPLNDALEKVASEHALVSEEIKRVAEQANIDTYLKLVKTAEDHYVVFDLADASSVIEKIAAVPASIEVEDDLYKDIEDEKEFSLAMYGIDLEKEASEDKTITVKQVERLKNNIEHLKNEFNLHKLSYYQHYDKLEASTKQFLLEGYSFGDLSNIIKVAAPVLSEHLITSFKENLSKSCRDVDFEKKAQEHLKPDNSSKYFKELLKVEQNFSELCKLAEIVDKNIEVYDDQKSRIDAPHLEKLSTVKEILKSVVKTVKEHPKGTAATIALPLAYTYGKAVQKKRDRLENNKMTYHATQRALLNKKLY
jgi:hypothetical protein